MSETVKTPVADADAFLRGQRDCMDALPPQEKSQDYTRGYATQYQHNENMAALGQRVMQ